LILCHVVLLYTRLEELESGLDSGNGDTIIGHEMTTPGKMTVEEKTAGETSAGEASAGETVAGPGR
jgi:hypothetical protein